MHASRHASSTARPLATSQADLRRPGTQDNHRQRRYGDGDGCNLTCCYHWRVVACGPHPSTAGTSPLLPLPATGNMPEQAAVRGSAPAPRSLTRRLQPLWPPRRPPRTAVRGQHRRRERQARRHRPQRGGPHRRAGQCHHPAAPQTWVVYTDERSKAQRKRTGRWARGNGRLSDPAAMRSDAARRRARAPPASSNRRYNGRVHVHGVHTTLHWPHHAPPRGT